MDIKGKIIWITGSSRGIGEATAKALAAKGAKVIVSGRTDDDILRVTGDINAEGDSALAIQCDVRSSDDIRNLVQEVKETWGSIDILINNAGIGIFKPILELSEDDWDEMMEINLKSAFLCSKAVLPDMLAKKSGKIINIVSVAGKQAYNGCGGYSASKFGMRGFTDVLRMETRDHGIQVTAVYPGATSTAIWGNADVDFSIMIRPDEVAQSIVAVCETGVSAHLEEIVLRPQGGDL
jgi:3-oxoacyl-[acyl-carrier protein] reductase